MTSYTPSWARPAVRGRPGQGAGRAVAIGSGRSPAGRPQTLPEGVGAAGRRRPGPDPHGLPGLQGRLALRTAAVPAVGGGVPRADPEHRRRGRRRRGPACVRRQPLDLRAGGRAPRRGPARAGDHQQGPDPRAHGRAAGGRPPVGNPPGGHCALLGLLRTRRGQQRRRRHPVRRGSQGQTSPLAGPPGRAAQPELPPRRGQGACHPWSSSPPRWADPSRSRRLPAWRCGWLASRILGPGGAPSCCTSGSAPSCWTPRSSSAPPALGAHLAPAGHSHHGRLVPGASGLPPSLSGPTSGGELVGFCGYRVPALARERIARRFSEPAATGCR